MVGTQGIDVESTQTYVTQPHDRRRAWARLSALAQRDATRGVLPAVGKLFGLRPAETRFGPATATAEDRAAR